MSMASIRRTFVILATFTVGAVVVFLSLSGDQMWTDTHPPIQLKWMADSHGFILDTPGCRIPEWDPYDPAVLPLFEKIDTPYKCPGRPHFFIGKPNAVVVMDEQILSFYYGRTKDNMSCSYRPILRNPGPPDQRTDNKFVFGDPKPLQLNIPLKEEFIQINCEMGDLPTFTQYMSMVPLKEEVENKSKNISSGTSEENLSIIIVGIDSVSKLNFLRHFRKTHQFLKENLSPIELRGYTKVADNTFPNLVPFLTGHFIEYYWNETMRDMFFDHIDLIWKNYSEKGYATLFAEDAPHIATFNYLKKGFLNPPADYYFRPFALAVEKSRMKQQSKPHCFQSKLEMDVLYGYLKDFVRTMEHRPLFGFTFVTRLTHDRLNSAGYADEPTFQLLRDLHDYGALNKSVVILFSDHGIRFGPIRQTYIGKFEERMPFIYLLFPQWFLNKYPSYATSLRKNEGRLTTPFDIHATLVHLLNVSKDNPFFDDYSVSSTKMLGLSLLNEIPDNRTCADAGILPHWCPCQIHTPVSVTEPVVVNAAEALIDTINEWIKPFEYLCVPLRLDKISDARLGQANDIVLRFVKHMNDVIDRQVVLGDKIDAPMDYLLTVRARPSGAMFEGTVRYDESEGTYKVLDDISRINIYGNQSSCVNHAKIRKFCYCRTRVTPANKIAKNLTAKV